MDNSRSNIPSLPPLPTPPLKPAWDMGTSEPVKEEVELPQAKSKGKMWRTVGMPVLAVLMVVGVAVASYFVSNRLSQQDKVALNVPESQPMAAAKCSGGCDKDDISNKNAADNTLGGKIVVGGNEQKDQVSGYYIAPNGKYYPVVVPEPTEKAKRDSSEQSATVDSGGGGAQCDTPVTDKITFSKAGKVLVFARNLKGTITLTGPKTVTIASDQRGNLQLPTTLDVAANEQYSIAVKVNIGDTANTLNASGWIVNKGTGGNACGPSSNAACGGDSDISVIKALAQNKSTLDGIVAGSKNASIQCWNEEIRANDLATNSYNDFTLIFGYAAFSPASCTRVDIAYQKSAGVWEKISDTSKIGDFVKSGDTVRLYTTGNDTTNKVLFRVKNGTTDLFTPEWKEVTTFTAVTGGREFYLEFTMGEPGTYSFEAKAQ